MAGKTVVDIDHQLSTIANTDFIIVLDDGFIVKNGSHVELRESGGLHAKFWHRQSGGFLSFQKAAE